MPHQTRRESDSDYICSLQRRCETSKSEEVEDSRYNHGASIKNIVEARFASTPYTRDVTHTGDKRTTCRLLPPPDERDLFHDETSAHNKRLTTIPFPHQTMTMAPSWWSTADEVAPQPRRHPEVELMMKPSRSEATRRYLGE